MIVIGTSLKVAPVSEVVGFLPSSIPQIYISRTVSLTHLFSDPSLILADRIQPVSHVDFDIEMLGDCDVVVADLCRRAGWELVHEMIPDGPTVDVQLQQGYESRYIFKQRG